VTSASSGIVTAVSRGATHTVSKRNEERVRQVLLTALG